MKVTIIGLGLIGGSIAKALKSRTKGSIIYAVDNNKDSIMAALLGGAIDKGCDKWLPDMDLSDIVIICTPVGVAKQWLSDIRKKVNINCIITDVGSTKEEITSFAESLEGDFCFIGAHPMSGSEKSGYQAASEGLFENTYYIITPTSKSNENSIKRLADFAGRIGAIPVIMEAEKHDLAVAAVSHLPHILSAALINDVDEIDNKNHVLNLAAGGFRDVTRIASSDPVMWKDITFANSRHIIEMMDLFIIKLTELKKNIQQDNKKWVEDFFEKAKQSRDTLPQKAVALMPRTYECTLDIPDRVGIIAEIATILGSAGVNIKNLYVANSREFYGGVLVISLSSMADLNKAKILLGENGFNIH